MYRASEVVSVVPPFCETYRSIVVGIYVLEKAVQFSVWHSETGSCECSS